MSYFSCQQSLSADAQKMRVWSSRRLRSFSAECRDILYRVLNGVYGSSRSGTYGPRPSKPRGAVKCRSVLGLLEKLECFLYRKADHTGAWHNIQSALADNNDIGLHCMHAAIILHAQGKEKEALVYLEKALPRNGAPGLYKKAMELKKKWASCMKNQVVGLEEKKEGAPGKKPGAPLGFGKRFFPV